MALVGRRPAQDAGDGQHVEEALLNAWRTGGALEMQAVMECMLSAPLDSEPDARVALCKQLLMPLATAVRIWLKDLEGDSGLAPSLVCFAPLSTPVCLCALASLRDIQASSGGYIFHEPLVCPVRLCDVGQAKIKELIVCDIERKGGELSPSLLSFRADV